MAILARRYSKLPPEILAFPWSQIASWWEWDQLAEKAIVGSS